MRTYRLLFFCLLAIGYFSCTDKTNQRILKRTFDGQECILVGISSREVHWGGGGIGGSCMVLPIPLVYFNGDNAYRIGCIKNGTDTIELEHARTILLVGQAELDKAIESIRLSFSPNGKQTWYARTDIYPDNGLNRIIHKLDNGEVFYSYENYFEAPNWANVDEPQIYFERLIRNPQTQDDVTYILWEIQERKPLDDDKIRLAFSLWYKQTGAAWYISRIKDSAYTNKVFAQSMQLLVDDIVGTLQGKENISAYNSDLLEKLVEINTIRNDTGQTYNQVSIGKVVPLLVKHFYTNDKCYELMSQLSGNDAINLENERKTLMNNVLLQKRPDIQVSYAHKLEKSYIIPLNTQNDFFLDIYLRHYPYNDEAYACLEDWLINWENRAYNTATLQKIERVISKKVNPETDSLSNELQAYLKKIELNENGLP